MAHAHLDRRPDVLGFFLHFPQQLADVGRRGLLPAVTLGEGQIVFEHVLHLIDVIAQRGNLGAIAQQG